MGGLGPRMVKLVVLKQSQECVRIRFWALRSFSTMWKGLPLRLLPPLETLSPLPGGLHGADTCNPRALNPGSPFSDHPLVIVWPTRRARSTGQLSSMSPKIPSLDKAQFLSVFQKLEERNFSQIFR
jgi:hypothetical protein